MTKRINLPSDSRLNSKFSVDEFVSNHHIIENIVKIRCCFIVWTPSSIYDLKSSTLNLFFNFIFYFARLLIIPNSEKTHFSVTKSPIWALIKLFYYRIEHVHDAIPSSLGIGAWVIFIIGLDPTYIIVWVRHQMNNKWNLWLISTFYFSFTFVLITLFFFFLFSFFNSFLIFVVSVKSIG